MASSSSSLVWKYDVFLSFRGEDTRKTFISHLYHYLDRTGIKAFKDDQKIGRGKPISLEFLSAIEQSRISIVVISENYATSSWCLDELVKIIECMETTGQIVIPIFYEVDPSHVKNQTGRFAKAFKRHEERFKDNLEKVRRWREAFTKVATIAGEDSRNWTDESMSIQKIVRDISDQLNSIPSSMSIDLIGMDDHMKVMDSLLCLESNEVLMVGIWGMGGIGKTTVARYVYDRHSSQFQHCCFIENVKENFRKYDLLQLQEKILSRMFKDRDLKIWDSCTSKVIKERLQRRKVLVVLDDVDELEQLNALAKETNWFGLGSRIIITTRDKRLLITHGVERVYEVKCLSHAKALQLFCQSAFKSKHSKDGFEELSLRAANYACGLPLALKVLGSFLCGRRKEVWEGALERLERTSKTDIMEVLRLSYDNLDKEDMTIFLYIACFFTGEEVRDVTRIIDSCGYSAELAINVLSEKSLIQISGKRIRMHDLIQKMGEEIVCQQFIDEPGKCKILSDPMQVRDALLSNTGIGAVEGIVLNTYASDLSLNRAFERLHNLKLLKFYGGDKTNVPVDMELLLPPTLRFLYWDDYPLKNLPFRFRPDCLVQLDMRCSELEELWDGTPNLANLKKMDLSASLKLKAIPDLSKATNLEELDLSWCGSLKEIHSSIRSLYKLTDLDMRYCTKLEYLPSGIYLQSLEDFSLEGCSSLKRLPQLCFNIKELFMSDTSIEEMPPSIEHLACLETFDMSNREKIISDTNGTLEIPPLAGSAEIIEVSFSRKERYLCLLRREYNPHGVPFLCRSFSFFSSVTSLELRNLNILEIPDDLGHLCHLGRLYLPGNDFKAIPASIIKLSNLEILDLRNCRKLQSLPELPPNLRYLKANNCISLESISQCSRCHLKELLLGDCFKLDRNTQLWIQNVASEEHATVFLPESMIPRCLHYHQATEPKLTVCLPKICSVFQALVFSVCIVVATENVLPNLDVESVLRFNDFLWIDKRSILPWIIDSKSDHVLLFSIWKNIPATRVGQPHNTMNGTTNSIDDDVSYDEVSFEFRLKQICRPSHRFKVKEYRVRLLYGESLLQKGATMVNACNLAYKSEENAQAASSRLSLTCSVNDQNLEELLSEENAAYVKRRYEQGDGVVCSEEEQEPNFKRGKNNNPMGSWISLVCGVNDQNPDKLVRPKAVVNAKRYYEHGESADHDEEEQESSSKRVKLL